MQQENHPEIFVNFNHDVSNPVVLTTILGLNSLGFSRVTHFIIPATHRSSLLVTTAFMNADVVCFFFVCVFFTTTSEQLNEETE